MKKTTILLLDLLCACTNHNLVQENVTKENDPEIIFEVEHEKHNEDEVPTKQLDSGKQESVPKKKHTYKR